MLVSPRWFGTTGGSCEIHRSPLGLPSIYFPSGCGKGVAVQVRVMRIYKIYIHQGIHLFSFNESVSNGSQASRRELGIWKRLCHDNIVPFLGIAYGFGMNGAISLVSQWMPNGTLHAFLVIHKDKLDAAHRLQIVCSHYSCLPPPLSDPLPRQSWWILPKACATVSHPSPYPNTQQNNTLQYTLFRLSTAICTPCVRSLPSGNLSSNHK